MIPSEIAALAEVLSDEFNIDFDEAVRRAWRVFGALEKADYTVASKAPQS